MLHSYDRYPITKTLFMSSDFSTPSSLNHFSPNQLYDFINRRQSIGLLVEPAPNTAQLELAIAAALTAPDHHRLHPWRFITIQGKQRVAFGELLAKSLAESGEIDPVQLDRVKQHPMRAPMILICIVQDQPHHKVPHYEQVLSCGAAIQNLLLVLESQGFSSMWRSGAAAESAHLKRALGCAASDEIAGLVYIGTASKEIAPRESLSVTDFVTDWKLSN